MFFSSLRGNLFDLSHSDTRDAKRIKLNLSLIDIIYEYKMESNGPSSEPWGTPILESLR